MDTQVVLKVVQRLGLDLMDTEVQTSTEVRTRFNGHRSTN